jgi:hypothetical protein
MRWRAGSVDATWTKRRKTHTLSGTGHGRAAQKNPQIAGIVVTEILKILGYVSSLHDSLQRTRRIHGWTPTNRADVRT